MCILSQIQSRVKVAKNLHNQFGNFNYRNVESIYEAVKPILAELECSLTLSDEVVLIGDRFYIKAVATIKDKSGAIIGESSAYARESLDKKGMDSAQITGSASSYARKYALGGLLLLDDNKDIDSQDNSQNASQAQASDILQIKKKVANTLKANGLSSEDLKSFFDFHKINTNDIKELEKLLDSNIVSLIVEFSAGGAK